MSLNATSSRASRAPEISVVVPSRDRPLRLRWLLNALEEQTLEPGRWEVVVCHDSGPETTDLLRAHPLAHAGILRGLELEWHSAMAGAKRNLGWRAAAAPVVVFTDDDCRPPPGWLEAVLHAAERNPGAVVQGATLADPDELSLTHAPYSSSQKILPPTLWAETCNIVYPRELLQRLGGFDEEVESGEDTDLALRAVEAGATYVAAPEALTYHAVLTPGVARRVREAWRWREIPLLVKRHPRMRRDLPLWIFWQPSHAWFGLAVAGAALESRGHRFSVLLALPWTAHRLPSYGGHPRARLRGLVELPGWAAIDLAGYGVMMWGSLRHRSLLL